MKTEFIEWTKSLSVSVEEIDEQHKEFIGIINKVHNLLGKKIEKSQVLEIINNLVEFARIHFETEEKYFKKWNYPYTEEHIAEHEKLLFKVIDFRNKFDKQGTEVFEELVEFIKDWLENHLKTYDFKYRDYFKEKGFI